VSHFLIIFFVASAFFLILTIASLLNVLREMQLKY